MGQGVRGDAAATGSGVSVTEFATCCRALSEHVLQNLGCDCTDTEVPVDLVLPRMSFCIPSGNFSTKRGAACNAGGCSGALALS